jgi:hypothetical protein
VEALCGAYMDISSNRLCRSLRTRVASGFDGCHAAGVASGGVETSSPFRTRQNGIKALKVVFWLLVPLRFEWCSCAR